MKKKYFLKRGLFYLFAMMALVNCKTPYDPPLKGIQSNLLVVEGYIDGAAPTTIQLSRTRMISTGDTATVKKELFARVIVEDDKQNLFPLNEAGGGTYTSSGILNLNLANKYRIHIITSDNKEYISDFVAYKQSPAIDSIGWKLKDDGIQVYVNTHDDQNKTRYYRWKYHETWEFHSIYESELKYLNQTDKVVPRNLPQEQNHFCWAESASANIILGSSAKLSNDVIFQQPLVNIENHSKKMSVLYSILVTQYALDTAGYNYWEAMRNNTEKVGSIFDPQPNQTVGNIQCITSSTEPVVGYIGAGSSFQKRKFIYHREMPDKWNPFESCEVKFVTKDSTKYYFQNGGLTPISEFVSSSGNAYTAAFLGCVDCTLTGSNIKPNFWP